MEVVSFDIAQKLKEKGYPQKWQNVLAFYNESGECFSLCPTTSNIALYYTGNPFKLEELVAPTISQVLKWLREEKRIEVNACWDNIDTQWIGYASEMDKPDLVGYYTSIDYDSYEQAAITGIEYVLDNLI